LVASDRDGRRLDELRPRARRAGVHNWEARAVPESTDARIADLRDQADVVLVDAPCSGLGALRRNPDARWRLDAQEVASFPPRQKWILERYARLVKPGGRLVYATCSINRARTRTCVPLSSALIQSSRRRRHCRIAGLGAGAEIQLLPHLHGTDGFTSRPSGATLQVSPVTRAGLPPPHRLPAIARSARRRSRPPLRRRSRR